MTERMVFSGETPVEPNFSRTAAGGPTFGPAIPIACRECGSSLVYPRPCPKCGAASTWVEVDKTPEPPLGTACWHLREGDPYGVERWWDGHQWTTQIAGGEKMHWLEHLTGLPANLRTSYTADQIELLTIDPLGPPSARKRSWVKRLFARS
jgi:hypothetical protein